jgi:hypothetical protein
MYAAMAQSGTAMVLKTISRKGIPVQIRVAAFFTFYESV